jgi:hypothetical protein
MARESFRAFSDELETTAATWAAAPTTNEAWVDSGERGGTESNPFKVTVGNLTGTAKPGEKKNDGVCRAAHEKIASDLAYDLKLPIPPVVLWDLGDAAPAHNRDRYVGISLWSFPQPLPWQQVVANLTDDHKSEASQVMSAMVVFETWVSCEDRKPDHVLAYAGNPESKLQLAFIDYAFSMSKSWNAENHPAGATAPYLPPLPKDVDSMRTMNTRILNLADGRINTVVGRVPVEYLPDDKKKLIISNLISRKQRLAALLGL